MNPEFLMNLGQLSFLLGTSFLIAKVLKNRNSLKDFDTTGSFITFVGMLITALALLELKMYISILISVPTILFWGSAFVFSLKNKHK